LINAFASIVTTVAGGVTRGIDFFFGIVVTY
jgi:hypothetical protein